MMKDVSKFFIIFVLIRAEYELKRKKTIYYQYAGVRFKEIIFLLLMIDLFFIHNLSDTRSISFSMKTSAQQSK